MATTDHGLASIVRTDFTADTLIGVLIVTGGNENLQRRALTAVWLAPLRSQRLKCSTSVLISGNPACFNC
jgi:hypothetical protein